MAGYEFLRKVQLFTELPEDDLKQLCQVVEEVHLPAGSELFAEGSLGDMAYVIEEGQVEILKSSDGRNVQLAVRQPGEVIGEMALLESMPRNATGRALTDSVLLAISRQQLNGLLDASPSSARVMLHTVTQRLRSTELLLRQSEKMAQLGTLTAGIAHELNNPAAAARRGAEQLRRAFAAMQQAQVRLNSLSLSAPQQAALLELDRLAGQRAAQPTGLDSLQRSDQESALEDWLDENAIANGWELAPQLAGLGYSPAELERLAGVFPGHQLAVVLGWLGITFTIYGLLEEIGQGATRISEIVKALKSYVYLDQAPVQAVDLHEGLDNTLVMLRSKLKVGVSVHRQYAADLPLIQAYGSELNQVWTNLIDNAVDAMDGKGEITIRTHQEKGYVVVEVEDNGPGIPETIQSKIFDPFFTTKPVGKGTGLGLNISYNIVKKHQGEIKVVSHPGMTLFVVTLPLNFEKK
ncbi:MAG: ATP-binding protein [Anaerolineaceae bacterium]|jgi:signal transduction histidine kinase